MSKLKCIVIEDEPLAVKVLVDYIAQIPFLQLEGTFKDAIHATEWLRTHEVQLIFLDIHLPKLKGMAFLKTLVKKPAVIITTAYHQYAVEGFEQNVTDYLLKPIEFERFLVAVNKVQSQNEAHQPAIGTQEAKDHLFLTVNKKKVRIYFADILYVESQREYIKVVTAKSEYLSRMSTHEIESLLPAHLFKRIHRSFIVSLGKIESYTHDTVDMNGTSLPVGRVYRDILENL
jgi:DNA-binding LytR/AlgR family response regulator